MTKDEIIREIKQLSIEDRLLVLESTLKTIKENGANNQIKEATETYQKEDFWNELTPEIQNEIRQGIAELDRGEKVSLESVLKEFEIHN